MVDQVLCTCVWCLQKSNGQGAIVSRATRARHKKSKKNANKEVFMLQKWKIQTVYRSFAFYLTFGLTA